MKSKIFDNVYPFTTEEIASYFPLLDLKEKKRINSRFIIRPSF